MYFKVRSQSGEFGFARLSDLVRSHIDVYRMSMKILCTWEYSYMKIKLDEIQDI